MPASMFGADTENLRVVARALADASASLSSASSRCTNEVRAIVWEGSDRDQFVLDYEQHVDALTQTLAGRLHELGAVELVRQADEQDVASEGRAHSSVGGRDGVNGVEGPEGVGQPPKPNEEDASKISVDDETHHKPHKGDARSDDPDDVNVYDVNQKSIGDCWFLASYGALATTEAGRELLAKNVSYDPHSQTYTVTFPGHEPIEVSNSFLDTPDPAGNPYSYVGVRGDANDPNLASVYEKAMAQLEGGDYGDIWGGWPEHGMETLTGKDATSVKTNPFFPWAPRGDAEYIAERLENGEAVTVTTGKQDKGSPIVGNHAYVVTGVTKDGHIIVYNPWGYNKSEGLDGEHVPPRHHPDTGRKLEPGELVIQKDLVDDYFQTIDSVKP